MLSNANGYALPGWEPERLAQVQTLFDSYKAVDDDKLRENLLYFGENYPGLRRGRRENGHSS